MTTELANRKRIDFKDIENIIAFNNWLKKNISLYKFYDYNQYVPTYHIKAYLNFLKDLLETDEDAKRVFKKQEWVEKIEKLLEDKVGELLGR
jgi:hypothetical protein